MNIHICIYKDKNFKSEKCILEPQRKHKVIKENRINYRVDGEDDDVELDDSVKLFQKLLRGRAYQTMVQIKNLIIIIVGLVIL